MKTIERDLDPRFEGFSIHAKNILLNLMNDNFFLTRVKPLLVIKDWKEVGAYILENSQRYGPKKATLQNQDLLIEIEDARREIDNKLEQASTFVIDTLRQV